MHFLFNNHLKPKQLLDFLFEKVGKQLSKRKIKWALEHNLCKVNCEIITNASYRLKLKDKIAFEQGFIPEKLPVFQKISRKSLLFENDSLIIINKPAFIPSDSKELLESLQERVSSKLFLAHRLDKGTTGALIFAKSQEVKNKLIQLFEEKRVKKTYYALSEGVPAKQKGIVDNFLGAVKKLPGQTLHGICKAGQGKSAKTIWELKLCTNICSLFRLQIITGRTHQIRCHLSQMKCPILGDSLYGKKFLSPYIALRPMLHAFSLDFSFEGEKIHVKAPVHEDFLVILKKLGKSKKAKSFLSDGESKSLSLLK
jgi:RluA family pseudouridine synthase